MGRAILRSSTDEFAISSSALTAWTEDGVEKGIVQWTNSHVPSDQAGPARRPIGLRCPLLPREGTGCWDFFRSNALLTVCVADAVYDADKWVAVEGERHFKVRFLLAGTLLSPDGSTLLSGPQGQVEIDDPGQWQGYRIKGGQKTLMLVFHCRKELLADMLLLDHGQTPPPFDQVFREGSSARRRVFALSPDICRFARRIIAARITTPHPLRGKSIELSSLSLLCAVMEELATDDGAEDYKAPIGPRDAKCVDDARRFLCENYISPPRISDLARRVGINQSKLKSAFKGQFGLTLYQYVMQLRMENAIDRILKGNVNVSEVSYSVGYEHPTSFTVAFKRYFGTTPQDLLRRARRDQM